MLKHTITALAVAVLAGPQEPPGRDGLTDSEFGKLFRQLTEREVYRTIPWELTVEKARERSAREKKPLLVFVAANHPFGLCRASASYARDGIFNDPAVAALLRDRFIPLAAQKRREGRGLVFEKSEWFEKLTADIELANSPNHLFIFSPSGEQLRSSGADRSSKTVLPMLEEALKKCGAPEASRPAPRNGTNKGPRSIRPLWSSEEMRVVTTTCGILDVKGDEKAFPPYINRGRLFLWLGGADEAALARGELSEAMKQKIVGFLGFYGGGRSHGRPLRTKETTKKLEMTLKDGRLTGSVHVHEPKGKTSESHLGDLGYELELLGFIEGKEGKLSRFDVVAKGSYWLRGSRRPLGNAFTLVDTEEDAALVPRDDY